MIWSLVVFVTVAAATAVSSGSAVADPAGGGKAGKTAAEGTAIQQAASSGHRVHISADDTETDTVYANPDGTLTDEETQLPTRVPDAKGDLVSVNLNLATDAGRLAPKESPGKVSFSSTGSGPLASLNTPGTGSFGLGVSSNLGAPNIDGATATYGVSGDSNTSVSVRSGVDGFVADMVLQAAPASAPTYDFPLTLNGLHASLSGGELVLTNDAGDQVAESAPLQMYDSQTDGDGNPTNVVPVSASLVTQNGQTVLQLTPSMDYLTASSTVYPVTIDPTVNASYDGDEYVSSANPTYTYWGDYRILVGSSDGTSKYRGIERYYINKFIGVDVTSATLNMWQYNAQTCSAKKTDVYAMNPIPGQSTDTLDWNTDPGIATTSGQWVSSLTANAGIEGSCANAEQAFDVTRQVNGFVSGDADITQTPSVQPVLPSQWANDTHDNKPYVASFELRADNETDANGQKAFCSMNGSTAPAGSSCLTSGRDPYLAITYIPQLGDQSGFSMTDHGLNSVSKLSVNNDNGNLLLTAKDLNIAGVGEDLAVDRYYNSQRNSISGLPDSSLGASGWSLGIGPDVYMSQDANYVNRYQYHSPSGTIFGDFVREATSPGAGYDSFFEPTYGGVNATLQDLGNNTAGQDRFELTFHASQTQYEFTAVDPSTNNLYLTAIKTRNGHGSSSTVPDISFAYVSGTHELSTITDTVGRTLSVTYNSSNDISEITDTNGPTTRTWQYGYNTSGQLKTYTDPMGNVTTYGYTGTTAPYYLDSITDPAQANGDQPTTLIAPSAHDSTKVGEIQYQSGMSGSTPTYDEFDFAYQDSSDLPHDCIGGNVSNSTTVTDVDDSPSGMTTYCFTNRDGATDKVTDVYDGEDNKRSTSYSPDENASSYTTPSNQGTSPDSAKASYATSYADQLDSVTQPTDTSGDTAAKTTYNYGASSSVEGYRYLPTSETDDNGNCTAYSYDSSGNVTDSYTGLTPDMHGACSTGGASQHWHDDYNSNGTVSASYDPDGSSSSETKYDYYSNGELEDVVKPGGSCSSPRKLCTSYTYDGLGRVLTKTDGRGDVTSYSYDKDDRVAEILFNGATTCVLNNATCIQYNYDGEGNLTSRDDVQGTTSFTYDWLNQQATETIPENLSAGYSDTEIDTTYDANGDLTEYDQTVHSGLAKLTAYTDTVSYQYNKAYEVTDVIDNQGQPGEEDLSTDRNNDGKISSIKYPTAQSLEVDYTYKKSGRPDSTTAETTSPSTSTLFSYNYSYAQGAVETDQLQSVTTSSPASSHMDPGTVSYYYDNTTPSTDQNPDLQLREAKGSTGDAYPTYNYTYDNAGKMTSKQVSGTSGTTYYGFDATGNLCWSWTGTSNPGTTSCSSAPSGATSYSQDADGNNTGTSANPITYNPLDQASSLNGVAQAYLDQTNDLRVLAGGSGGVRSINGPMGITARVAVNGAAPTFYTRLPDGQLLDEHGNIGGSTGYEYYVEDGQGSVVALVGTNGTTDTLDASYVYDPYGGATANAENGGSGSTGIAATNPFRYRGAYQDVTEGDGYLHFGARFYDASTGRFTQPDPKTGSINNPMSMLSYQYAQGDPVNQKDLTGEFSFGDVVDTVAGAISGYGLAFASLDLPLVVAASPLIPGLGPALLIGGLIAGGLSGYYGSQFLDQGASPSVDNS